MADQHRCDSCKQLIRNKWLNVESFKFHPECFKCSECNELINRKEKYYRDEDGDDSFICNECTQRKSTSHEFFSWGFKNKTKSKPKSVDKPKNMNDENKHATSSKLDSFGKKLMSKSKKFAMEKVMKVEASKETDEMCVILNELDNLKLITHSLSDGVITDLYKVQENISLQNLSLSEAFANITAHNLEENGMKKRDRLNTRQQETISKVLSENEVFVLDDGNEADPFKYFTENIMALQLMKLHQITNGYLVKMEQELMNPIHIYATKELKYGLSLRDEYESIKMDYDFVVHKLNKLRNPNQKHKVKQNKIDETEQKKIEKYELLQQYREKMHKCVEDLKSKQKIHLLQCIEKFWKSHAIFVRQQAQIIKNPHDKKEECEEEKEEKKEMAKELRYRNPIKLASGSFATVYRATDSLNNEQTVAIKKICIGEGDNVLYLNSTKAEAENEVKVMKKLNGHKNIVQLMDDFYEETVYNDLYLNLIMEYVPNTLRAQSLFYAESGETIPHKVIQLYAFQIIRAINYMHIMKMVHRDVKPENVLIDLATHQVKLCDFGCSIKIETRYHGEEDVDDYGDDDADDPLDEEKEGNYQSYVCSRYYRAPELILGSTYYDCKIDMWSIGVIVCEMFLGTILFEGNDELQVFDAIMQKLGTPKEDEIDEMKPYYAQKEKILAQNHEAESWNMMFCAVANMPQNAINFISNLLIYSPKKRHSALKCLTNEYFHDLKEINNQDLDLFNWNDAERKYAKMMQVLL